MRKISLIVNKQVVYKGKWLDFNLTDFSIGDRIIKNYESVSRKTKPTGVDYDAVCFVPILESKSRLHK